MSATHIMVTPQNTTTPVELRFGDTGDGDVFLAEGPMAGAWFMTHHAAVDAGYTFESVPGRGV